MSKEEIYDERISPLMAQIIAICKEHKINMAAQFALDAKTDDPEDVLFCTTSLPSDPSDTVGLERVRDLTRIMRSTPAFSAFIITHQNAP
jgi:hypothetical protein